MFSWLCTSARTWLLFDHFKQSLIFHSKRSPWPWFVFESDVIFDTALCYSCSIHICRCMQKHNDTIKTSGHSSLEKYTSHFIWKGSKGLLKFLLCERWVGDWTELQHIDPHSYSHHSVSFPFSWVAQPGAWGPSFSGTWSLFQHLLSNWSELQLLNRGSWWPPLLGAGSLYSILSPTRTSCAPSYIIVLRPLNSTCRQSRLFPWCLRPDALVIYTGAFPILTAQPGSICNTRSLTVSGPSTSLIFFF